MFQFYLSSIKRQKQENITSKININQLKQITNKKVIVKYEIVADLPELKKLIAEFGKIGSNLNQIARYFNTGGLHSQEMRNEIKKSITEIYKLKYEVIKLAGDFITVNANNRNSAGEN